jgi:hypothetical protein
MSNVTIYNPGQIEAIDDVRAVQQHARHANPQTTMRYDDNRRDLAGKVNVLAALQPERRAPQGEADVTGELVVASEGITESSSRAIVDQSQSLIACSIAGTRVARSYRL